ncbi:MAG TPA: signal peptidase II [Steroidobacteraceae bacterium]|jgi:signal peptidase II|nr:signal peptidase II [Steroidobacteraceae bacterium]
MNAANERETGRADRLQDGVAARAPRGWRWLPITVAIMALDQLVKLWVVDHLALYRTVRLLPVLDITLTYNRGAAFSLLAEASGWQKWLFAGLAVAVVAGIVLWLRRLNGRTQWLLCLSLTLIMGGALGNLIDRLRIGHVVDFILAHWHGVYFPWAFNVADSAITVGAALLLTDAWLEARGPTRGPN